MSRTRDGGWGSTDRVVDVGEGSAMAGSHQSSEIHAKQLRRECKQQMRGREITSIDISQEAINSSRSCRLEIASSEPHSPATITKPVPGSQPNMPYVARACCSKKSNNVIRKIIVLRDSEPTVTDDL